MKAYGVRVANSERGWDLVWAETRGQAKRKSEFYGDVDFTDLRARRCPLLDNTPNPTDAQMVAAGWVVFCARCSDWVADNSKTEGDYMEVGRTDEQGRVYCVRCVQQEGGGDEQGG